jgi:hypothetical protein
MAGDRIAAGGYKVRSTNRGNAGQHRTRKVSFTRHASAMPCKGKRNRATREKDNELKLLGLLTTGLFLHSVAQRPSPYHPPANETTRLAG